MDHFNGMFMFVSALDICGHYEDWRCMKILQKTPLMFMYKTTPYEPEGEEIMTDV